MLSDSDARKSATSEHYESPRYSSGSRRETLPKSETRHKLSHKVQGSAYNTATQAIRSFACLERLNFRFLQYPCCFSLRAQGSFEQVGKESQPETLDSEPPEVVRYTLLLKSAEICRPYPLRRSSSSACGDVVVRNTCSCRKADCKIATA